MWVYRVLIYRLECGVWEGVECECVECEGVWSVRGNHSPA